MSERFLKISDVQAMLDRSVVAFDRSVEVYRTPTPYGFTIRPHLRPYLAEATQEMINEGNHRTWKQPVDREGKSPRHTPLPERGCHPRRSRQRS